MTLMETMDIDLQQMDMSNWAPPHKACHEPRSGGAHLSSIIAHLWFGSLPESDPQRKEKEREWAVEIGAEGERSYPLRMALGLAWEWLAAGLYPDMVWQPGEFERDGIIGSPDGLTYDGELPVIDEMKLTFKSCRDKDVLRDTLWMWQIKGYMAILQCTRARLHVCYVNGDYTRPYTPIYRRYVMEIGVEEREEMWTKMFVPAAKG